MSSKDELPTRRFLTIDQVADELNVGTPQIRALLRSGDLRGIQVGGRALWRISRQDLENYIVAAYAITAERIAEGLSTDIEVDPTMDERNER